MAITQELRRDETEKENSIDSQRVEQGKSFQV
jgi:hypothetical protein